MKKVLPYILCIILSLGTGFYLGTQYKPSDPVTTTRTLAAVTVAPVRQQPAAVQYVLNLKTKKFHKPSCSSVKQMKESNKEIVTWSRQEIIDKGYDPCGRCHP